MDPRPDREPDASRTLSPNDHVRTLIELTRPAGADLARRWLAALLVAPPNERPAIVEAIERRIVEVYAKPDSARDRLLHVAEPPVQRDGYVEQVIRSYAHPDRPQEADDQDRAAAS